MAGIGFELKKLFNKTGYINNIKAYMFTALVTVGPTILSMTMVISLNLFLSAINVGIRERELFLAAITYSFAFSLTIGGIIGITFYAFSPLGLGFKFVAYILYMEMIMIWILSVYLSAVKDYMKIVKGFALGVVITFVCTYIFIKLLNFPSALSCLMAVDIGNLVIILSFMLHLKRFFSSKEGGYFRFLTYFDKYTALFLINFAYTLGIYAHNFIFWGSKYRVIAGGTYIFCPLYDIPAYFAFLTIITAMVIFIATVETSFYEKYKSYYSAVLGQGTLADIKRTKKEMQNVMVQELTYVMELQLFFTFIFMIAGITLLPRIGFVGLSIDIFNILTLGSYACIIMFIVTLLLLYFDDRKSALLVSMVFVTSNIIFTILTLIIGENFYGFGFFLSSFLSLFIALFRLNIYIRDIDYYTFCSQPIVYKEREGFFTWLVKKIYG